MKDTRELSDLVGVGKATLKDFEILGIKTLGQLSVCEPKKLYNTLCERTREKHDICALDVFSAAIAQAKNPRLSKEKCNWWYWSKKRKGKK